MTCLGGRLARTRQPGRYAGQSCLQSRQLRNNLLLGGDAFGRGCQKFCVWGITWRNRYAPTSS